MNAMENYYYIYINNFENNDNIFNPTYFAIY